MTLIQIYSLYLSLLYTFFIIRYMSNIQNLKNFWEKKVKETNQPIQKSPVIAPAKIVQTVNPTVVQPPVPVPVSKPQPIIETKVQKPTFANVNVNRQSIETIQIRSVKQLTKNFESSLNVGVHMMGNLYQAPVSKNSQQKQIMKQPIPQQNIHREAKDIKPIIGNQRMPTFEQRKLKLQNLFQKKQQAVISHENQQFIDLKKEERPQEILQPEERTDFIIKKVFNQEEKGPNQSSDQSAEGNNKVILNKNQEVKNLSLRVAKKEKRNLGDFDDA